MTTLKTPKWLNHKYIVVKTAARAPWRKVIIKTLSEFLGVMYFWRSQKPSHENKLKSDKNTASENKTKLKKPVLYGFIKRIMAPKEAKDIKKIVAKPSFNTFASIP